MRFMYATKVTRSGQVALTKFSRANSEGEPCGGGHCTHYTQFIRQQFLNWRHISKSSSNPIRRFDSTVSAQVWHSGVLRNVFHASRQIFSTIAESCQSRSGGGGYCGKKWDTIEERMDSWTRCFWWVRRPLIPHILCQGQESCLKAHHPTFQWRRGILVILTGKKGQAVLRSLGLAAGVASFLPMRPRAMAEQLQGKTGLNSLNRRRHSPFGQSATFLLQTVELMGLVLRAVYLLGLFMPCFILAPFADAFGGQVHVYWLELLLTTLERAGPAFIKWGQWAATRPDVFPQDVCDSLSKLHMQAPSHSFRETREICESAFEARLEDIFDDFSEDPVASGSIAQVHRAVLKGRSISSKTPQYVAVKVRHPDVSRVIQRDFMIIKWLAYLSTNLPGLRHLQLDKTVQQFASFMTKQVDLTLEAAHLLRFIYNFRRIKNVSFPVPIYPWVHPAVLVETYEEGQSISKIVDLSKELTRSHSQLAYIGSSALLKMLLNDNFIHGDLHPGNIYVRFTGNRPNVILLDVGMTAELNQRNRDILLELFKAVAEKDGLKVAKWTLLFSEDQSCPDPEGFARDVDAKFKEYLKQRGTAQNTGECMNALFDQVRKHRVNMDGDVCTVMVTTLVLEGWQRKLDPDLDIIKMVGDLLFKQEWAIPYEYALSAIAAP